MFSRAIGSYWGPMLYSVFATLLQGIFCLGSAHHVIIEETRCLFALYRDDL